MELDRNMLNKISLLDDESLRAAIGNVAKEMGLDSSMVAPYLRDMEKIKSTVSNLTAEDWNRIQSAIGEENTKNIVSKIQKEIGEN